MSKNYYCVLISGLVLAVFCCFVGFQTGARHEIKKQMSSAVQIAQETLVPRMHQTSTNKVEGRDADTVNWHEPEVDISEQMLAVNQRAEKKAAEAFR